jgi:hypothetical protein
MRSSKPISLPALKPRNPVLIALARSVRLGSGRHTSHKRTANKDRKELDERVRESGQW